MLTLKTNAIILEFVFKSFNTWDSAFAKISKNPDISISHRPIRMVGSLSPWILTENLLINSCNYDCANQLFKNFFFFFTILHMIEMLPTWVKKGWSGRED